MIVLIVLIFILVYDFSNNNNNSNLTSGDFIKLNSSLIYFTLLLNISDIDNGIMQLYQILIMGLYSSKLKVPKTVILLLNLPLLIL